jgi:predicted hotdog family 3-hydroxylacyl-ACP dehydratase
MRLDHTWIAAHIPHQGQMCLLDEVLAHSPEEILCRASSHRSMLNPLRSAGRLHALCAIEYAAQAAAIYGALYGGPAAGGATFGMLASVRDVSLELTHLDELGEDLIVSVRNTGADANICMFEFTVSSGSRPLVSGRGSIVLKHSSAAVGRGGGVS